MYDLDDGTMLVTLEALLGVRDDGWRHLAHPLPFDTPGVEIEAVELDPSDRDRSDPHDLRRRRSSTGRHPMVVPTGRGSSALVPPDSFLAGRSARIASFN